MGGPENAGRRLFVAATLPDPARTHLAAAVDRLRTEHAGFSTLVHPPLVRWTDPASWHLTLVFCGSVAPLPASLLVAGLGPSVAGHGTLQIRLAGGGRFGHRVLWAGVGGDRAPLVTVAATVAGAARTARIAVDDRPYRAHLTIARGRTGADFAPAAAALGSYAGPTWLVEKLVLIESVLGAGPGGTARYVVVETFPLG